jgi:hypothetical protein
VGVGRNPVCCGPFMAQAAVVIDGVGGQCKCWYHWCGGTTGETMYQCGALSKAVVATLGRLMFPFSLSFCSFPSNHFLFFGGKKGRGLSSAELDCELKCTLSSRWTHPL